MKRCNNCGWFNSDDSILCEKCGDDLPQATIESAQSEPSTETEDPNTGTPCPKCGYPVLPDESYCPNCGATVKRFIQDPHVSVLDDFANKATSLRAADYDPDSVENNSRGNNKAENGEGNLKRTIVDFGHCESSQKGGFSSVDLKKTVCDSSAIIDNIERNNSTGFVLEPYDSFDNDSASLCFSGESIVLSRQSIHTDNIAISDQEQAMVTYEGGAWYIEDKSGKGTTYVAASHKIQLQKGDVIVLGNKKYIFK